VPSVLVVLVASCDVVSLSPDPVFSFAFAFIQYPIPTHDSSFFLALSLSLSLSLFNCTRQKDEHEHYLTSLIGWHSFAVCGVFDSIYIYTYVRERLLCKCCGFFVRFFLGWSCFLIQTKRFVREALIYYFYFLFVLSRLKLSAPSSCVLNCCVTRRLLLLHLNRF
jgi:hypothetical protein